MRFTEEEVGRFIKITQMQLAGGGRKKKVEKVKKLKRYTVQLLEVVRTWEGVEALSKKKALENCASQIGYVTPLNLKRWEGEEEK